MHDALSTVSGHVTHFIHIRMEGKVAIAGHGWRSSAHRKGAAHESSQIWDVGRNIALGVTITSSLRHPAWTHIAIRS